MGVTHKKHSILWRVVGILFILAAGLVGYMRYIEPKLLITRYVTLEADTITPGMDGLRIIQFTDTQLGDFYTLEDLEKVVNRINQLEADIVVFTGDLIDHMKTYEGDVAYIADLLHEIHAPKGKFAIYGNHDQGGGAHRTYPEIMKDGGFKLLVNKVATITFEDGGKLNIAGIDDWLLGYPELDATLHKLTSTDFNIALIHEPDVAQLTANYPVDLQLSGHTHGGQIRLPFIGALITPPAGHKYTHGMYTMGERLQLYVNTGLGNTKLPLRLMNIPEITVFTLKTTSKK